MSTSPAVKKNLGWLWIYIILIVLSVAATLILIIYNLGQQLKPDQIAAAQQQWRARGPADYRLIYNIKINDAARETHVDQYDVTVRAGSVVKALKNGRAEAAEHRGRYRMDKLLEFIAGNLEKDQEPGRPRTFTRAMFDPKNGALFWHVRRVMGSYERVEITVEKIETP